MSVTSQTHGILDALFGPTYIKEKAGNMKDATWPVLKDSGYGSNFEQVMFHLYI